LEGNWVSGILVSGVFKFSDGDIFYMEKFDEGEELIQGRYVWKNGDEFIGQWKHGKRCGRVWVDLLHQCPSPLSFLFESNRIKSNRIV
jgi:hypothetical protein